MKREHPIEHLSGIGSKKRTQFHQLGIVTIGDLLSHLPFRFESFSSYGAISDLQDKGQAVLDVVLEHIQNKRSPRKRMYITEAIVSDGSDRMRLVWFGQPYIAKTLSPGDYLQVQGKVTQDPFGYVMQNPQYTKKKKDVEVNAHSEAPSIFPVYRLTYGLHQKAVRAAIAEVLPLLDDMPDWIPEKIREKAGIIPLGEAYKRMHAPKNHEDLENALYRLKFDELLPIQLRAQKVRELRSTEKAPVIPFDETQAKIFVGGLPFALTPDQKLSAWSIFQDLQKDMPMNRLLIGDVGSGKTIVAAMVADMVAASGKTVAMMAPTEILAVQHYESLTKTFDDNLRIGLITGSFVQLSDEDVSSLSKQKQRAHIKQRAKEGTIDIIIGTHALLTKDVEIANLGLVIVDEQHRFGVSQRKAIKERQQRQDESPHFLSMTATPIPRTFALAMYGDVDVSYIKTMPVGRKQIITQYIPKNLRNTTYDFVRQELDSGRQAFVICSRIDESGAEHSDKKAVKQEYERLKKEEFANYRVAMLHGKMSSKEKDETMSQFANGDIDVLVSTSVVEVGVNIPNASVMIIEDAERFGLAQLHQFRGRVGRGEYQSYCLLFSESSSSDAKERLNFFATHSDGFSVAEYDLERRGAGEVYGTKQSGEMNFQFASLLDIPIISKIESLVKDASEEERALFADMLAEYESRVHLE